MKPRQISAFIAVLFISFIGLVYVYNYRLTQSIRFDAHPVTDELIKNNESLRSKDTINILIIDGGGIRGLIPLYIIQHIEEQTGKPIDELFDIFSGVSTGAIIATGLNTPPAPIKNNFPENASLQSQSEKIIDIYKNESKYVFSVPWYHKLLTANGFFSPRFSGDRLRDTMEKHYTEKLNFTDLKNYVIIPSLNIHTGQLQLFKNRGEAVKNLPTDTLYQLVTAAASAETLFPPVDFVTTGRDIHQRYYADAGIYANNPTSIVLREITRELPGKNYYVLILGAGTSPLITMETNYRSLKNWGRINWVQDLISNVQRSMDDQQLYTLEIAQSLSPKGKINYNYLNVELINPYVDPFDYKASKKLKVLADRLLKENKTEVDQVISTLKENG
ncbi:patatin-like phospholipase family protein [Microbulbifer sp. OS29]|uniref:Patatin-like phospholipase family protein n=1 Tax=Microbulbifer okhotskensis TaxID=2926617 RepID=A0A9X2EUB9_9GAMM|nr:patatin-like phospholipase family protein [Microbulbifer okhotskensis]MCO1335991.1 patatin-like phospholipase family protein [Microbulbifer okhotskensis]